MAKLILEIPDEHLPLLTRAYCAIGGYPPKVPDPDEPSKLVDNPQTQAQFAVQAMIARLRQPVAILKADEDAATARNAAAAFVQNVPVIATVE